ncbi:MAG: peptidase C39 [Acidobacteria bacterium]|jgi:ABC-type bacteriocin/lantibiotic exporter with double-glycine peptidase domain|nr:MAG: peptidase C39 [Acidobacteriota bacterium]
MLLLLLLFPFLVSFKLLDVPFVRQKDQFCGPASLSSVLAYYGLQVPQEEIAEKTYIPKLKGALITDLENYTKGLGLRTRLERGSLQHLRKAVDEGIPSIILVDIGLLWQSLPHYMVVVGYEGEDFYLHTGYEEKKLMSSKELDRIWGKMGRAMLLVYPP